MRQKFDRVCRNFVKLDLLIGSTHGAPSESDVAPVSLQSRTYSAHEITASEPGLSNVREAEPRSLFCASNRLKSWNTGEGSDQRFWPCFAAGLNQGFVSSVAQAMEKIRNNDPKFTVKHFHCHSKWHGLRDCRFPKRTHWGHH